MENIFPAKTDGQQDQESQGITLPDLRAFKLHRYNPHFDPAKGCESGPEVEEIVIHAHSVQYGDNGLLAFVVYELAPEAPNRARSRLRYMFNQWIDVEEVSIPKSSLITH